MRLELCASVSIVLFVTIGNFLFTKENLFESHMFHNCTRYHLAYQLFPWLSPLQDQRLPEGRHCFVSESQGWASCEHKTGNPCFLNEGQNG